MATGTRKISKEQFSDGTTIDGNRIEKWLTEIMNRVNGLKRSDIKNRFIAHTFVGGYSPQQGVFSRSLPWMNAENTSAEVFAPTVTIGNQYRHKGTRTSGITEGSATDYLLSWTTPMEFLKPTILDFLSVSFIVDNVVYANTFNYQNPTPPPGKTNGESVDDIKIIVSVDNHLQTENRQLNDQEIMKYEFKANTFKFNRGSLTIANPMQPTDSFDASYSINVTLRDLNIPLPEKARVRFSIIIPRYGSYNSTWGTTPAEEQIYSWNIGILEELL